MPNWSFFRYGPWTWHTEVVLPKKHTISKRVPAQVSSLGQACDVFICHRGPQVKGNLVGHIRERLQRANLTVFVDYGMRKGVESWAHVLATLRGARGVLLLMTGDFEESPWCLEETRAVAARLDEGRMAGAQQGFVLPVFIDRETRWNEGKLGAAFIEFSADRDFEALRAEEPELAGDIVRHWRNALDPVARTSYMTHSFESRRYNLKHSYMCLLVSSTPVPQHRRVACSFDVDLVDKVQQHFLDIFYPLSRPAIEHEVELPGVVDELKSQLLKCQVCGHSN